ncbi:SDR family NAD(P)-dependent oxidoreductase [Deferribacter autotrophicus]|uniref:SDR family NAD(P)-dependent oxidoreductase n=1 Tax=Deferribacter autotrophicus TaxID=500465 RepID=A0A5A8F6N0_9BACT|nr:SDR family NAD(P)-dependent oxidoreductase [Deferribacter autotrophicus]KAA0258489.1 SDR family NAD(P)-dependent oxidoreductase [Deferribacter autotrophicus]
MKTVLITGASKGIGYHLAKKMADQKLVDKMVLVARSMSTKDDLKKYFEDRGVDYLFIDADLSKREDVDRLYDSVKKKGWKIDVLVNNAGRGIFNFIKDESFETINEIISLNVTGLIYLTSLFIEDLIDNKGTIVNIASVAGRKGFAGLSVYCATKWAVVGFSESLRDELCSKNVRVITVEPGLVDTDWGENLPESFEKYKKSVDMLKPEVVAETILFALKQPASVSLNEILIRPTNQPR